MPDKPRIPKDTRQMPLQKANETGSDCAADASNNQASNGYWVHDEIGPKHYVPPSDSQPDAIVEVERVAQVKH